jgi:hypothetical protein
MSKQFAIPGDKIRQLVPAMGSCLITDRVTVAGLKIGYMYREEPDRPEDSGWRFFSGEESQDFVDDPSHIGLYAVNTAANYDPDIISYLDTPAPCAFEKDAGKYRRVDDAA